MKVILESTKQNLVLKDYAFNTQKTYLYYLSLFGNHFKNKNLKEVTTAEIELFFYELIQNNELSYSAQSQYINAVKFYYEKVLNRPRTIYNLPRPKKSKTSPKILSKNEVKKNIDATQNIKHRSIITLLYSAGLRRSELTNLKVKDIDSERMVVNIQDAKGRKDRLTLLSKNVLYLLRQYFREYKPKTYLFEGMKGGKYSPTSIAKILNKSALKAGIRKNITPHMLRNSFAKHLLEQGTDLRYIQELLGHNSNKRTEIYTHVSRNAIDKIVNPIDEIFD